MPDDGRVYAFGEGGHGELGMGEGKDSALSPLLVSYVGLLNHNSSNLSFLLASRVVRWRVKASTRLRAVFITQLH
jgi:hypothetical protein